MSGFVAATMEKVRQRSVTDRLKAFWVFLISLLRPDFWGSTKKALEASGGKVGKTAYLDGLRGFAALMIYSQHNMDYAHPNDRDVIHHAWGWQGNHAFITFPGVRLFFHTGNLAVMLFFAISGYVTSVSLLKLLYASDTNKMAHRIGVGIPQRFVRLWAPAMGISFTFMMCWHIFNITPDGTHNPPAPTLLQEIPRWIGNFFNKSYIFSRTARNPNDIYDPHLWYIPLQFQASILTYVIFLCFIGFVRYPAGVRIWVMIAVTVYFGYLVDSYFCALTTFGTLMCDLDLLAEKGMLPKSFNRRVPGWIWYIPLIVGLYLSTCPSEARTRDMMEDPVWNWLIYTMPPVARNAAHWFNAWAGVLVLIAIPRINWLRKFFELPVLRDFGKITFSFYLVQGPLLWTIGARLYAAVGRVRPRSAEHVPAWINLFPLPDWGPLGLELNYIAANLILLPFMVWVGSVATKVFEAPSNKLALWLFNPDRYQYQALPQHEEPRVPVAAPAPEAPPPPPAPREEQLPMQEVRHQPAVSLV